MNLKIELKPQQGYNKVFDVGEYGMKLTKFGVLKLAAEDREGHFLAVVNEYHR